MSRSQLAAETAAITDPAALYRAMVDLNGTLQNMVLRRMDRVQIEGLRAYAATQPPSPFSNCNGIEFACRAALRK